LAVAAMLADAAAAADPLGTWLTEGGKSRVRLVNCGGAVCGSIIWLREPNDPETAKPKSDKNNADAGKRNRALIGVQIVLNMRPNGADKWSGQVYSPEEGKVFSGNLTMQGPNSLKLEGCALGGLVCR